MLKTRKFDILDHLKTEEAIEAYLDVTLEEGDYQFLPIALADIARARKAMASAARAAGVTRTNLYQSLSEDGRPAFETVAKVANSLGYRIALVPVSKATVKGRTGKRARPQKTRPGV